MEKTFEELLTDDKDFAPHIFGRETVLKLLQQVREATIEECADIELDSCSSVETQKRFDNLPNDRIKIYK